MPTLHYVKMKIDFGNGAWIYAIPPGDPELYEALEPEEELVDQAE